MKQLLLAILLMLLLGKTAAAKSPPVLDSIGIMVQESERVVRGVPSSAIRVELPGPLGRTSWWKITLDIHETLKGTGTENEVWVPFTGDEPWMTSDAETLFFLVSGTQAATLEPFHPEIYRTIAWTLSPRFPRHPPINLNTMKIDDRWPVVSDDLRMLPTKDLLLNEARNAVISTHGKQASAILTIPPDLRDHLGLEPYWLTRVAITNESQVSARTWTLSQDWQTCLRGVAILVHERSPENIEGLRRFMQFKHPFLAWYRAYVLGVLRDWGVSDLPPLVVASGPTFNSNDWVAWASLSGLLILPAAYGLWQRRRTRLLPLLYLTVTGIALTLSLRSFGSRDAATWRNFDLAGEHGYIYLLHHQRATVGIPSPFIVCAPVDLSHVWQAEFAILPYNSLDADVGRPMYADSYDEILRRARHGTPSTWWAWSQGPVWRISTWGILALTCTPWLITGSWQWWKKRQHARAQGFPVTIKNPEFT